MTEILETPSLYDVAVVGGGPAGLAAALALAETGARTALIARRLPYADNRTTALLGGSTAFLESLDVWHRCADKAAALTTMRLVDDTGRLIRAPEVKFVSDEIGLEAFGYNIENRELMIALEARAAELTNLTRIDDEAEAIAPDEMQAQVRTKQGQTLSARLIIGADGRQSLCREAAGIEVKRRPLDQSAVTFNITHSRPHKNMSTEFHTSAGPCVFVPLPGNRSSIVWVNKPRDAERLMALSDEALSAAAEKQSQSILGRVQVEAGRYVFPLAIEQPRQLARNRIVLVRFEKIRRSDISSRTFAIDMANRSLLSDLLPMQAMRSIGMHLMGAVGPLRRLAMREGLSPSWRKSAS